MGGLVCHPGGGRRWVPGGSFSGGFEDGESFRFLVGGGVLFFEQAIRRGRCTASFVHLGCSS